MSDGSIRAVLFDADGVVQTGGPFAQHACELLGCDGDGFTAFLSELFSHPLFAGCLDSGEPFLPVLEAVLDRRSCPTPPEQFLADWLRIGIQPDPEVLELVARLRAAGTVCSLATNQDPERALYMDEELGYGRVFDHSFYSCRMRLRKPDLAYFHHMTSALGLQPAMCLFLDDREENVGAARQAGLKAEVVTATSEVAGLIRSHGLLPPMPAGV
ncbi:MAG TPA: HAD-IA family hydrolase [Acidimicrobiales bacterium]|nr:HAD-IA family hydrolase [Acidimicrobiales bacterium]